MIVAAILLVYYGRHMMILGLVMIVQANVYRELVLISIRETEENRLPTFKMFYYYWFLVAAIFMYGRTLKQHFEPLHEWPLIVQRAIENHVLVCFALYITGLVGFVWSLGRRKFYRYQFSQLAYCHMALLAVVVQSTYLAANLFEGLIWFMMPCGMVVCNDCMAYIFGVWCGRTPLIKLSPKKTVEGFVGALVSTVVWAFFFCRLLEQLDTGDVNRLMLCPKHGFSWEIPQCDVAAVRGGIHVLRPLTTWVSPDYLPTAMHDWTSSAFQFHCVIMAIFASLVAPFGGFFASGFKRAFHIKDFASTIPGHGGFTDRMDCQIIMGSFSYLYLHYVLHAATANMTLRQVTEHAMALTSDEQTALISALQQRLTQ